MDGPQTRLELSGEEQNLYPLIVMTGVGWRYSERLTYLGLTFKVLKPFITRQVAGCGQF
ncbi:hypothetical protein D3C78_1781810 [compost metagenome]